MLYPVRYVVTLCLLVVAGMTSVRAEPPYPWPAHSIVPIFFVPKDWDVNSSEVQAEAAALRSALLEVRQFYAHGLGGNTFVLNDLTVVQANGPKESYGIHWNGGNIYTDGISLDLAFEKLLTTELHDRGFPIYGNLSYHNEEGYIVLMFVKGAGGFAGGNGFGYYNDDGGRAIYGDWAIDSLQGQVAEGEYWWSGRRIQLGAVAHELGHGFGLIHPDEWGGPTEGVIMYSFWDYPNAKFADYDNNWLTQQRIQYFTQCLPTDPLDPPPAVKPYELHMLPTLGSDTWALHINERGWISGTSEASTGTPHQALFDPDLSIFDLGTAGGPMAQALSVNDNGVVVGFWTLPSGTRRATFSLHDSVTKQWTTRELAIPPSAEGPVAVDINNVGTIVGGTKEFFGQATVWSGAAVSSSSLGSQSLAQSINNHNQIVGRVVTANGQRAFLWTDNGNGVADPGEWIDLGVANTLQQASTEAFSINEQGQITGSLSDGGMDRRRAFSLAPRDGQYVVDAGNGTNALIKVLPRLGRGLDYALDANNSGVVVGRSGTCAGFFQVHASLWQNDKVQDLNDLVPPQSDVTLISAESINDAGEIVGKALTSLGYRGFLLRPIVPAPPLAGAATVAVGSTIVLTWKDRSRNEWGFEIQRRAGIDPATADTEAGWLPLITVGPNVATYTDPELQPGTTYQYRIRAFNDNGNSGYQVWQAVQTPQNRPPVAAADVYSLHEDKVLRISAAKGLLANDLDPDGDALTIARVEPGPHHGQLEWAADGSFTYTPEHNYAGKVQFQYVVKDAAGAEATAAVTLKVSDTPDRPHAHHDTYRTSKNTRLCVKSPGVLANDDDGDHDKLRAVLREGPHHGHLDLEKNGSFCYRPHEGFHGEDRFRYYAVDRSSRKDDATVTIHVEKHRD